MNERNKALVSIILTVLFWGFSFISIKISVQVLPPMTLGAARFLLAVVFLHIVKKTSAVKERLKKQDLPYLLGAGLIGVTAYFFFENNGVSLVSASEASLVIAAIPVLTMIAEYFAARLNRKNEHIILRRWVGAVLSMIGVWMIAGVSIGLKNGSSAGLGYLYMFGAALSWVAYCFLTKPLFARRSRLYIVYWQSLFGFIGFIPFALLERPHWGTPDVTVLMHVAYLGVFCSALGYWLYARSLHVLGIGVSTVFVNLVPVVTVAAGFIFLHERLSPLQWLGAAIVMGGVYLTTLEKKSKKT